VRLTRLLFLFLVFTATLLGSNVNAAHLVGGEISYQCVGGNKYAVKLRVYRDCGGGGAQFDAQAAITIFDVGGVEIQTLLIPKGPTISISGNPSNDPCITVPSGLCTEYAEYKDTVELPPIAGGYVLTHQRCCRNNSITNVVNSGSWGNTYTVDIPSMDTTCNSSPNFVGNGPSVICIGDNLNLPITATDADNDSLFFELCDILHGGSSGGGGGGCNVTVPNPACPPPYQLVPFDPPYTAQDPLPASPAFGIDGQTGVITGKPNMVGQFVVGICVSEYRNGVKLSTVRLDYQFNVANCGQPIAKIETPIDNPTMLCDGLTVTFTSLSSGGNTQLWLFGNPPFDTSTAASPTVVFPQPGAYPVTLVLNPGLACGDTIQEIFNVQETVDVEIGFTGIPCFEVQGLIFEPTGYWRPNSTFFWDFGSFSNVQTSTLVYPPPITFSSPGLQPVSLTLTWDGGLCQETFYDTVEISNLSLSVDAGPDQTISPGDVVQLNGMGGAFYQWSADGPVSFSDPTDPQATTIPLNDTTTYYMNVSDEFGCAGFDSLRVFVERVEAFTIMNVITPNGDGKNDVLDMGSVTNGDNCSISIMSRWGDYVFRQDVYQNDWGGVSTAGKDLEDGTYYFILQCGNEVRYRGPVTIIRNQR
jgi:gliding motility-associated-like protein